ncbi:type III secretion system export apparatus subunit SctS [Paraburkholderia dinghuensis]|uniref:EscS/YscS/HrcS family type III secretion system export apparatus protein n=1 Tax=Paraburkholderia dinghuensis TaxID=2305225 RepID=A0A3N6NJP6_9BURK|nr:type III secretion system export apparatus subunit SctS [Paraburkholderia dinghuensis]RQH09097.1 EscS/YscS/HrcS family type III secretion system export apparatus protein [Paraburkholderia dinghuensis]
MNWSPSLHSLASDALLLVFWLSLPTLVVATAVGLLIGLVQSITQIQDQALPYSVKIIAVAFTLMIAVPWGKTEVSHFLDQAFSYIATGRVK